MRRRLLNFLHVLLVLVTFCCAMRLWQYYFSGVRLPIYHLLLLTFVANYVLRCLYLGRLWLPPPVLRLPVLVLWVSLVFSALSYFLLDSRLAPASTLQFTKGMLDLAFIVTGITCVICFLNEQPPAVSHRLLQVYILGAVASSIYSFFEVSSAWFGHDLGRAIFGRLSFYGPDFDWSQSFYYEWDGFFRAVGFTGVNSQATYTASVIPLLILARPFRRQAVNLSLAAICFAGTVLTFSRNGFASLLVCLAFYAMMRPARVVRFLPRIVAICVPVLLLALVFSDGARQMVSSRLYRSIEDIGHGRREIYASAWNSIKAHPFGHGLNQFSLVVLDTDEIDLSEIAPDYSRWSDLQLRQAYANLHNNWLNWLFEGGWLLFFSRIAYYASLLLVCWQARTDLGRAAVCSLGLLLLSGFFNMTLDLFSTELFFAILPVCVVLAARAQPPGPAVPDPALIGAHPLSTC